MITSLDMGVTVKSERMKYSGRDKSKLPPPNFAGTHNLFASIFKINQCHSPVFIIIHAHTHHTHTIRYAYLLQKIKFSLSQNRNHCQLLAATLAPVVLPSVSMQQWRPGKRFDFDRLYAQYQLCVIHISVKIIVTKVTKFFVLIHLYSCLAK